MNSAGLFSRTGYRLLTVVASAAFLLPNLAQAQTLNQQVNGLLANNCAGLLQGAGSNVLASNLQAACTGGPGL